MLKAKLGKMSNELASLIREDYYRATGLKSLKGMRSFILHEPTFRFIIHLRMYQYHKKRNNRLRCLYSKLVLRKLRYKYGLWIPSNIKIGRGFYIGHIGTIILNENAIIGNNVNISAGCTLGKINTGRKMGVPIVGNNVWIGTGAVIVGNIVINDDVLIAPNAYVNFDVPSHSLVIGNPGVIHHKMNATDGYVCNKV